MKKDERFGRRRNSAEHGVLAETCPAARTQIP